MVASLVLLPFAGASSVVFVRVIGSPGVSALAFTGVFLSLCLGVSALVSELLSSAPVVLTETTWFEAVSITMSFGLSLHLVQLTLLMAVLPVSCGVHLYSIWYLSSDPHLARFMSYISLFTSFMVLLAVGSSTTVLFVSWESVSVMSYLLIAYWTTRETALQSAVQALLLNRSGDLALTCALACMLALLSSTRPDIASLLTKLDSSALSACVCSGALVAAMGKSAQLSLHSWLPNAMEAPTPVSALIHAATLVTASVYLLFRLSPFLEISGSDASLLVASVGAATLLFAGLIGGRQTDLKRVIAFSTCSQVAYMILAVGTGLYSAGMSLLVMHAAYKALLFLGAGVVIHAVGGMQDIRLMGGLAYALPFTAILMLTASAALSAMPYTSGDYSKDLIIELQLGGLSVVSHWLWILSVIGAGLTLFYSVRLQRLVFEGTTRASNNAFPSGPEVNMATVTVVLLVLYGMSLFEGFASQEWLNAGSSVADWGDTGTDIEWSLSSTAVLAPLLASAVGAAIALVAAGTFTIREDAPLSRFIGLAFTCKFYFDTLLNAGIEWAMAVAWLVYGSIDRSSLELVGPFSATLVLHRAADLYQLVVSRVSLHRVILAIVVFGLWLVVWLADSTQVVDVSLWAKWTA